MDYNIIYLPAAEQDMDDIGAYLSQFYENTLKRFMYSLKKSINNLRTSPYLGAQYRGCRRLVVGDYLVFYKVDEAARIVKIYRVLHGTRNSEIQPLESD